MSPGYILNAFYNCSGTLEQLDIKRRCLRRYAGCLKICMRDSGHLSRLQGAEPDRSAKAVVDSRRICDYKLGLVADIIRIFRDNKAVIEVDQNNTACRNRRRRTEISLDSHQKSRCLRRYASGRARRDHSTDPHARLQTA